MAMSWREREVLIKAARKRIELREQAKRDEAKRRALKAANRKRARA
jgi:hypothetical protein